MTIVQRLTPRACLLIGLAIIAATAATLLAFGQPPICTCGFVRVWQGDVMSAENSQQLSDWYSPSHFIHGLLFYGLMWLLFRRQPLRLRVLGAMLIECAWEILENTPMVINRYREATIALGYSGDSVINSVFDVLFMLLGFVFAWRLPVWASVAIGLFLEILCVVVIRDNLTLNVLMLLYPLDSILTWQSGG
ncbi:MAG TPA: DUF2585 domain-containing protein [Verrucomicrobiae bacterium]|nr:DUF2585 domain-containing protein [Verrucomicrobiae bacterium]